MSSSSALVLRWLTSRATSPVGSEVTRRSSSMGRPTIFSISSGRVTSSRGAVKTLSPSRSTVTRSASCITSFRRWEM